MSTTRVRRVAIGSAVVIGLLVAGAAIFAATFDVNRYKANIVDAVRERTGRTLAFDGDLGLSLVPRIAVTLPATTLSEPKSDAVFARVESARATVALLPLLLHRRLAVDGVRIDGLQATVVRRADGTTNVDDLRRAQMPTAGGPVQPDPSPASTDAPGTVGAIELRKADLTWRDLRAQRTVRLSGLDLKVGRIGPGARTPLEANGSVAIADAALATQVKLNAELEWDAQGAMQAIRAPALKGEGSWKQRPLSFEARAESLMAGHDTAGVRGLAASINATAEDGAPLEIRLAAPLLEANKARSGGERIEATLARRGARPVDVKIVVDGVRGTADRIEATGVRATGSLRDGARLTRFNLAGPLSADLGERAVRVERAAGDVTLEDPALGHTPVQLPVTASASIDAVHETVALQFDVRAQGLAGRGTVRATGFTAPRLVFDIDAEEIDADRYIGAPPAAPPPPGPGVGAKSSAGGAAAARPGGAPTAGQAVPRDLNAAGTVRVARMRLKGVDVADVRASVKAASGRIDVAPFSLRAWGGAVNGRAGFDARAGAASLDAALSGIQLRNLAPAAGRRVALEGRANGTVDLTTAGSTADQMKRALQGKVALDVRDGGIVGIDLADLLGTAASVLQSRGRQSGALDENKRTPFSTLTATVHVKDGIATSDDLAAKSPQLDIGGRGRFDIASGEVDYLLQAKVLPGPATEGSGLRSLAGMTVPVRIAGPVEHPSYAVDWAPIAAELLLRRAGRGGPPSQQQLLEGLGDLLKRRK